MRDDLVTITASLLIRYEATRISGYVVTTHGATHRIASVVLSDPPISQVWREDFRVMCQHIAEETAAAQRLKFDWVLPQEPYMSDLLAANQPC